MERKEAIEVVKKNYPHVNVSGSQFETALRTLIPELKESEDERIRKDIISHFAKGIEGSSFDEVREKYKIWIAWLEKQGEQKSLSEEDENIIEWLIGYLEYQIMNATITEEKDNCLDAISMLKSIKYRVQPKPAWSEEDKDFMYDTLSNLTELKDRYGDGYGNVGKCIGWLKSLKDRYTWKPSDEQIEALDEVYKTHGANNVCRRVLFNLMNDLKKLKE